MVSPGLFRLSRDLCAAGVDDAAAVHALRALLAVAGGVPRLADLSRTQALFSKLRDGAVRATLSRAAIDARRSGIWIRREARNVAVVPLRPPVTIWDGRWRIGIDREKPDIVVAPLGASHAATLPPGDAAIPESLARAAFSVEPGLFDDDGLVAPLATPAAPGLTAHPIVAPFARFAPGFDLALAQALCALVGAPRPPAPFNNHIAVEA